jgi:transcriptional regulator with XRE-family HTH domain
MPDNEKTRKALANRLAMARQQAGLSQGQVAKLIGWHRPTISETEAGRRSVTAEELTQFAEIYDVSFEWLAGVTGGAVSDNHARIELAARELAKLKKEDLQTVMDLLRSLRNEGTSQ